MSEYSDRLNALLERLRISQSAVARRMGRDSQWVNNRVLGTRDLKVQDIKAFAEALDMPVLELCRVLFNERPSNDARIGEPTDADWQATFAPLNREVVSREVLEDIGPEIREIVREVIVEELDRRLRHSPTKVTKGNRENNATDPY